MSNVTVFQILLSALVTLWAGNTLIRSFYAGSWQFRLGTGLHLVSALTIVVATLDLIWRVL